MAEYESLSELRSDLTAEDPDDRVQAYSSIDTAGVDPTAVLDADPPVDALTEAGVINDADDDDPRPAAEAREETVQLLREIRDAVGGDA